jgi:hypothetical protein
LSSLKIDSAVETILEIVEAFELTPQEATDSLLKVVAAIQTALLNQKDSEDLETEKSRSREKFYFGKPHIFGRYWGLDSKLVLDEN